MIVVVSAIACAKEVW